MVKFTIIYKFSIIKFTYIYFLIVQINKRVQL